MKLNTTRIGGNSLTKAVITASTTILLTACGAADDEESAPPLQAVSTTSILNEDTTQNGNVSANNILGSVEYYVTHEAEHGEVEFQSNGQYIYTPNSDYFGNDSFSFYAEDDRGFSNIAEVSLTINPVNDSPIAENHSDTVVGTEVLNIQLPFEDIDGDSLMFSVQDESTQGQASISDTGLFSYQAHRPFNGTEQFTFQVSDPSGLSDQGTITIEVSNEVVQPPLQALDSSFSLSEDSNLSGMVQADNIEGTVQFYATSFPENGELTISPEGAFQYSPNADFNGADSFTFYAEDARGYSNLAEVSLTINPANDSPTVENVIGEVYGLEELRLQLTGSDIDGDELVYALASESSSGSAAVTSNGEFVYQANTPFSGTETLTFTATDPSGLSAQGNIHLEVSSSPLRFTNEVTSWQVERNNELTGDLYIENLSSQNTTLTLASTPDWLSIESVIIIDANSTQSIPFTIDTMTLDSGTYSGVVTYEQSNSNISQVIALQVTEDITAPAAIDDLSINNGELYNMASLSWTAISDNGREEVRADRYELRVSDQVITEQNWYDARQIQGLPSPELSGTTQSFSVSDLEEDSTYYFAIRTLDDSGNISSLSNTALITTPEGPAPIIDPTNISATITEGLTETFEFTLTNNGGSPLVYSTEIESGLSGATSKALSGINYEKVAMPTVTEKMISGSNGNIIVRTKPSLGATLSVNSVIASNNLQVKRTVGALNLQVVSAKQNSAKEIADTINKLNSMPEVIYAEPDYTVHAIATPNDALFYDQWALNNEGQTSGTLDADIDAIETWSNHTSGSNTIVAVIDTGVKYDHEDLASNMWSNPGEIPNNGIDDDNNGHIDDVYGYDFVNNDGDPMDDNDHGTHCAGIIGADTNNGIGIAGTVHDTQIMALKFLDSNGSGSTSAAIDSIIYAVDNGADILSNSWGGGGFSQALYDAIQYAMEQDVLFIAAAGNSSINNDSSPHYPSNYDLDNVISVASTTHTDSMSSFSNYGATTVDLGAPGSDILSTVSNGGYATFSGTSMATPYVSGAAVMLHTFNPQLSALEIKEILLSTVDPISALEGRTLTGGRLNLESAMAYARQNSFITITENPTGQIPAGESSVVSIEVNTTDKRAGLYQNALHFDFNSPTTPDASAAVNITVMRDGTPPASINDLSIDSMSDTQAVLSWTNTGDDSYTGNAQEINIAYSTAPINDDNWNSALLVTGIPALNTGEPQQFTIDSLQPNTQYYFAVKAIDSSGEESDVSNNASQQTLVGARIELTPATLEPLTLPINSTGNQTVEIANLGDMALTYDLKIVESANASTTKQSLNKEDKSINVAKGEFDYRQGQPTTLASGGPDVFGYTWTDSHGDTTYDWQDISGVGESLTFSDDSVRGPVDLGFSFPFYGNEYSQIWVSSNGFLSFDPNINNGCCSGQPIPSADQYNNLIAWAWDDLYPSEGYSVNYLAESDKVTFQFTNYGEFGDAGLVTAQVILFKSGRVKIQYNNFTNGFDTERSSVGIENADGSDGLQVVFNTAYLEDQLAVEFFPPFSWVELSHTEGQVDPFNVESDTVTLDYDSSSVGIGVYSAALRVRHTDSTAETILIPLQLEVSAE